MSEIPIDLKFLDSHEWTRVEEFDLVRVGISDYAQGQLGDIVYVELPDVGASVQVGHSVATLESVKSATDVYTPVSGEIIEVNEMLRDKPGMINEDAYGNGWIFVVRMDDAAELDDLLDTDAYAEIIVNDS